MLCGSSLPRAHPCKEEEEEEEEEEGGGERTHWQFAGVLQQLVSQVCLGVRQRR
jgi:hypothetical protein